MPFRLVLHLPEGPRRVPLSEGEHVLGSEEACDIRVRHMTVSRRHARLRAEGERLRIEDLGSSNGTSVDSRPVDGPTWVEAPCRFGFGAVRAELETLAAGDMVSAVRVPALSEEPRGGIPSRSGPEPGTLSDGVGRTLSSSALEELTLRRLPGLVEDLALGSSAPEAAQRVGADLFHSLPCYELEIWKQAPSGKAIWFTARTEVVPTKATGGVEECTGDLHIRAGFVRRRMADQLAPLIRIGLHLVAWSARMAATAPSTGAPSTGTTAAGAPAAEARKEGAPSSTTPLPAPASVDPVVRGLYAQAERVARSEIGILIHGESGTGKEVMARFVHRASGKVDSPFVAINCAALPRDLLEVELFGIEHAVATGVDARPGKFELAHGGTLFLDEIGDMAAETQAKILRVLQEGELFRIGGKEPRPARPRVLAATHRDLDAMIREGSFRRDLYYRLAGFVVRLPALRERLVDLPNLAARFLAEEAASLGRDLPGISVSAMDALMAYDWPGNIRELRHEIGRAALFLDDGELLDSTRLSTGPAALVGGSAAASLEARLEQFERSEILRALDRTGGDVPKAAELLDIGRSTLYRRIKALGVRLQESSTS